MRTIREIARLHLNKQLSLRAIAGACNLSVSTVQGYVKKIDALGLDYEAFTAIPDKALAERLKPVPKIRDLRPGPDIQGLVEELKRSGTHITRQLLYEEYQQQHPDGYKKTRFYEMLNEWKMQDKATMRMTHTPGEKLFIDFSGDKPSWINPETGVLQVQRRILAPLRNRRFFSLEELNAAIAEELEELNSRLMYQYCKSRKELFLELEQHRLAPLPKERFTIGYWKKAKVHVDYHISVDKSYYSVPFRLIGKQVDIKYTGHLVLVYHEGEVVAQHIRTLKLGQYITDAAHMPHEHRFHREWSPERIRSWG